MPHILRNKDLEVHVDLPLENYNFSRFDWTGKIVRVKFQEIDITGVERMDSGSQNQLGKGFYNEFGIEHPPGFPEATTGGWFHKIGIGSLKKDSDAYIFHKAYEIEPAEFKTVVRSDGISISCRSKGLGGFAYLLKKEILLLENGFTIDYTLENTGERSIVTTEYVHNFIAIDNQPLTSSYVLKFPFRIKPDSFGETVNPENKIAIGKDRFEFLAKPEEQFFFSNLSGGRLVSGSWELLNRDKKVSVREIADFETDRVNLWGWTHVISPELFFKIDLSPGRSVEWQRRYEITKME